MMMRFLKRLYLLALAAGFIGPVLAQQDTSASRELGRQIYLFGQRAGGQPLVGRRGGADLTGAQAACVSCHRRSGLGGVEGVESVPPISGRALFGAGEAVVVRQDKRFSPSISAQHANYDERSFADAVRTGRHISGREMSPLMARYALTDTELQGLGAYLRTLSVAVSPGVTEHEIHLATVIAPGVEPTRKKAFLDTLDAMVNQHNVNVVSGMRQRVSAIERRLQTRRSWKLDVWTLTGPKETWAVQLDQWQLKSPVFAVLSGLALDHWQPVQDFCEKSRVACWFPSVDIVPEGAEQGTYSLYFSNGVQLEAEVLLKSWLTGSEKPSRVVQLVGSNPRAQAAAQISRERFTKAGLAVQDLAWSASSADALGAALSGLSSSDALMLWMSSEELETLTHRLAAPLSSVVVSATFASADLASWTQAWRNNAWLLQRLELPPMRAANLARFEDWRKYRNLTLVDEKMQSEVYFAVNSFSWMLTSMLNNLHTDYLIERGESTLSLREATQVQEEVQAKMMGGGGRRQQVPQAPMAGAPEKVSALNKPDMSMLMKREGTTAYPRLSLAVGQRFASKGAYLQKVGAGTGSVNNETSWIVP